MQVFDVKIRLGGQVEQEVIKDNLSASEITLLRYLHGDDAVLPLKFKGDVAKNQNDKFQTCHSSGEPFAKVGKSNKNVGDKEHYQYLLLRYEQFPQARMALDQLFGNSLNPNLVVTVDEENFMELAGGSDEGSDPLE